MDSTKLSPCCFLKTSKQNDTQKTQIKLFTRLPDFFEKSASLKKNKNRFNEKIAISPIFSKKFFSSIVLPLSSIVLPLSSQCPLSRGGHSVVGCVS
jgi:hypothetical protein